MLVTWEKGPTPNSPQPLTRKLYRVRKFPMGLIFSRFSLPSCSLYDLCYTYESKTESRANTISNTEKHQTSFQTNLRPFQQEEPSNMIHEQNLLFISLARPLSRLPLFQTCRLPETTSPVVLLPIANMTQKQALFCFSLSILLCYLMPLDLVFMKTPNSLITLLMALTIFYKSSTIFFPCCPFPFPLFT